MSASLTQTYRGIIENFVMEYLLDNGIGIQLVAAVAKDLFGQHVDNDGTVPDKASTTPKELVSGAITDIIRIAAWSDPEFDLQRVIDGAASLHFLVRYARLVDPQVIPRDVIPSDELVTVMLELFHDRKKQPTVIDT